MAPACHSNRNLAAWAPLSPVCVCVRLCVCWGVVVSVFVSVVVLSCLVSALLRFGSFMCLWLIPSRPGPGAFGWLSACRAWLAVAPVVWLVVFRLAFGVASGGLLRPCVARMRGYPRPGYVAPAIVMVCWLNSVFALSVLREIRCVPGKSLRSLGYFEPILSSCVFRLSVFVLSLSRVGG